MERIHKFQDEKPDEPNPVTEQLLDQPKIDKKDNIQSPSDTKIFPDALTGVNFPGIDIVDRGIKDGKGWVTFKIVSLSVLGNHRRSSNSCVAGIFGGVFGTHRDDFREVGSQGSAGSPHAGKLNTWANKICQETNPGLGIEECESLDYETRAWGVYEGFLFAEVSRLVGTEVTQGNCEGCTPAQCPALGNVASSLQTAADNAIDNMQAFVDGLGETDRLPASVPNEVNRAQEWLNDLQRHAFFKDPDTKKPPRNERIGCVALDDAHAWASNIVNAQCNEDHEQAGAECRVLLPLAVQIKALTDVITADKIAVPTVCRPGLAQNPDGTVAASADRDQIMRLSSWTPESYQYALTCYTDAQMVRRNGVELMTCHADDSDGTNIGGKGIYWSEDKFDEMIAAFDELSTGEEPEIIPVAKFTHEDNYRPGSAVTDSGLPSFGRCVALYKNPNKPCSLLSDWEIVKPANDLIDVNFPTNSIEVYPQFTSERTHKSYRNVLFGNAWLGGDYPANTALAKSHQHQIELMDKIIQKQASMEDLHSFVFCCNDKLVQDRNEPGAPSLMGFKQGQEAVQPKQGGIDLLRTRLRKHSASKIATEMKAFALEEHQALVKQAVDEGYLPQSKAQLFGQLLKASDPRIPEAALDYDKLVSFFKSLDIKVRYTM